MTYDLGCFFQQFFKLISQEDFILEGVPTTEIIVFERSCDAYRLMLARTPIDVPVLGGRPSRIHHLHFTTKYSLDANDIK